VKIPKTAKKGSKKSLKKRKMWKKSRKNEKKREKARTIVKKWDAKDVMDLMDNYSLFKSKRQINQSHTSKNVQMLRAWWNRFFFPRICTRFALNLDRRCFKTFPRRLSKVSHQQHELRNWRINPLLIRTTCKRLVNHNLFAIPQNLLSCHRGNPTKCVVFAWNF